MFNIAITALVCIYLGNLASASTSVENEMFPLEDLPFIWRENKKNLKKQTLENYPSPFQNHKACNRYSSNSYLCDPGGILAMSEADRIEEILNEERRNSKHFCPGFGDVPYKFGVGIASDNLIPDKELLATELCQRWSLNHSGCDDGIILILFPSSKEMLLHWERGVEPIINIKIASAFYRICRNELNTKSFAQGAEKCVKFIAKRLSGETLPMEETMRKIVFLIIATVTALLYITCMFTAMVDRV